MARIMEWIRGERGQDFIEYALVIGVIVLVLIAAFLTTDIEGAVGELSVKVQCALTDKTFSPGPPPTCA